MLCLHACIQKTYGMKVDVYECMQVRVPVMANMSLEQIRLFCFEGQDRRRGAMHPMCGNKLDRT